MLCVCLGADKAAPLKAHKLCAVSPFVPRQTFVPELWIGDVLVQVDKQIGDTPFFRIDVEVIVDVMKEHLKDICNRLRNQRVRLVDLLLLR